MCCLQNKTALAKINKDLVELSDPVDTSGPVTSTVLATLLLNLFFTTPLTSFHSDFLLPCLDTFLPLPSCSLATLWLALLGAHPSFLLFVPF